VYPSILGEKSNHKHVMEILDSDENIKFESDMYNMHGWKIESILIKKNIPHFIDCMYTVH